MDKYWISLVWIALAGGSGALLRHGLSSTINLCLGHAFPYGTLLVNIIGSTLMGWLYVLLVEQPPGHDELRAILMIGLLGGFTTFSSFSIETLQLMEAGTIAKAMLNILLSVILCLVGCWLGIILARRSKILWLTG